jgi:hypothetical protein
MRTSTPRLIRPAFDAWKVSTIDRSRYPPLLKTVALNSITQSSKGFLETDKSQGVKNNGFDDE